MNTVYIYALRDPRDGRVFYVGKSINPHRRANDHFYQRKFCSEYNVNLSRWIEDLVEHAFRPMLQILERCDKEWRSRERYWISEYRRLGHPLLNIDIGGRGKPQGIGHPCPEWWKRELSRRHKGQPKSDEMKRKVKDSNLRTWSDPKKLQEHGKRMKQVTGRFWNSMTPLERHEFSMRGVQARHSKQRT